MSKRVFEVREGLALLRPGRVCTAAIFAQEVSALGIGNFALVKVQAKFIRAKATQGNESRRTAAADVL